MATPRLPHTESAEFAAGIEGLLTLASRERTAIMCAEVLWWRCHRRIIPDVLVSRGVEVVHILSATKTQPHVLRPPARMVEGRLTYGEELDPQG